MSSALGLPTQLPAAMQFSEVPDQVARSTGDLSCFGWAQAEAPQNFHPSACTSSFSNWNLPLPDGLRPERGLAPALGLAEHRPSYLPPFKSPCAPWACGTSSTPAMEMRQA